MSKKHIFLRIFQTIALFACVFCVFFISPVFATLPAGYTELEYIETTAGTEYIDPQVTGNARWVITAQTNAIKGSSQSLITSTDLASGGTWYGEFTTTRHWDIVSGGTNIAPTTKTTADLTFDSNGATGTIGGVSVTRSIACTQGNWRIFGTVSGIGPYVGKLFDAKVYQNNTLVRNFIPAKRNSDNAVGMYDVANSRKNLFDKSSVSFYTLLNTSTGAETTQGDKYSWASDWIKVKPSTTYYFKSGAAYNVRIFEYNNSKTYLSTHYTVLDSSFTTGANCDYIRFHIGYTAGGQGMYEGETMITEGSTAPTSYEPYPFYTNAGTGTFIAGPEKSITDIQIATTKFVDEEFKAAEAQLATTVQTIESVVSRTIAQTGQIQVLQDTKQTRPDENCPANMKCLLVQDEDGTPHWYPIIEP